MPELNNLVDFTRAGLEVTEMPRPEDAALVAQFLRTLRSPQTLRKRREQLGYFVKFAGPLAQVTADTLRDWRDTELDELVPTSRNAYMSAVRSFYTWLRREHADAGPWADLSGVKDDPVPDVLAEHILTPAQVRKIFAQLDVIDAEKAQPWRYWYTFFRLQYELAARINEIAVLKWDWVTPVSGGAASFTLYGKFGKTRWVQTGAEVYNLVRLLPKQGPRVFMTTDRAARVIFHRAAVAAGLPKTTSHWLRHSRLSHLVALGISLVEVRDMAGHKDISTTSRYLHVSGPGRIMPSTIEDGGNE